MSTANTQRFFLVGTGAAGIAMARWLASRGHELVGAWNRSSPRAAEAERVLRVGVQIGSSIRIANCDLILVAVADQAISEVGTWLRSQLHPGMIVAHLSGVLPASAIGSQPVPRASLHPLVALRSPELAVDALDQALFTVEGERPAVERIERLIESTGARIQAIQAEEKPRYHASAVLAANLVVALLAEATELAGHAGVADAENALVHLATSGIENVLAQGLAGGLTGPIRRGDAETVRMHLTALDEPVRALYLALSRRALTLVRDELSAAEREALENVLGE